MGFRLTAPPALETPAQRLAVLLAQPGREVKVVGPQQLYIICADEEAILEFQRQLQHGLAIRRIRDHAMRQYGLTFCLEIYP